jgi:hypothetical protein
MEAGMNGSVKIDSFSGPVASLPPSKRTDEDVLALLREHPMVSCFDMSELGWLRVTIASLERRGLVRREIDPPGYPWIAYRVVEQQGDKG